MYELLCVRHALFASPQDCPLSFLQRQVQRPLLKTERRVEAEPTTELGGKYYLLGISILGNPLSTCEF